MSDFKLKPDYKPFEETALDSEVSASPPPPGGRASSAPVNDETSDRPELASHQTTECLPDASQELRLMSIQAEDTSTALAQNHLIPHEESSSLDAAENVSPELRDDFEIVSTEDLGEQVDRNILLGHFFDDEAGNDVIPPPSPDTVEDPSSRILARQKYGLPDRGPNIRSNYDFDLCYDQAKKIPVWVREHLTKENLNGDAKPGKFRPDPNIPSKFSAQDKDYAKSGYSRGHMAAASNHKYHQVSMDQVFWLSNIVPQDTKNNNKYWNYFEDWVRGLTLKFEDVYVTSGPVFKPRKNKVTNIMEMVYTVFNDIHVPTHLFKVILIENTKEDKMRAIGAFMVPNENVNWKKPLKDFQVEIEELEKLTGLTFFPELLNCPSEENLGKFVDYSFAKK